MKYKTLLIDPPYMEMGAGKCKRGADKHYPVLHSNKIKWILHDYLKDKVNSNCHLYLWVTNNFLKDGLMIMDFLGFRYITNLVWIKDKFGLGYYFRGQHELCLFGIKGNLKPKCKDFEKDYGEERRSGTEMKPNMEIPTTIIKAKRTKHSKKPDHIYKLCETVSYEPRLELFARDKRDGWDIWGNEIIKEKQNLLK